ncbi:MAG: hypothetical protein M3R22_12400 [Pseudomonadota bacterium]|nr:hypothetical protein [Pseudomonadota bacterium]
MLLAGAACFAAYALSGQPRYRHYGIRLVQWTVVAGLVFFAVLIVLKLTEAA